MMRASNWIIIGFMAVGLIVLCTLGTWQVKRLFWKEALIERVNKRLASDPVALEDLFQNGFEKAEQEYLPVTVIGTFDHANEVYFFTTGKSGTSGWTVHTPLELDNGKNVIVNRGFVPFDLKDPAKREEGQVTGIQQVTGLLRFPLMEKPLGSLENSPEKREYFWRNVSAMAAVMDGEERDYLPVIIDAGEQELPGGWPQGGTALVTFSNNHLQYAVTWFGLALTLLGVGGYFLYTRNRGSDV